MGLIVAAIFQFLALAFAGTVADATIKKDREKVIIGLWLTIPLAAAAVLTARYL
jgi:hypothetical protein